MGVDIYTSSGILFTLEDAIDKFFKGITSAKLKKLIPEIESTLEDDEEHKANLKAISAIADLKIWFNEFANSKINDDYLQDEDKLSDIFNIILENTKFVDLPDVSFQYFTSNRYSGYDVPTETICVIFSDIGIFETKLTKKGQKLAKLIGSKNVQQTTWTVYSY
jgi:hypothetical protein